MHEGREWTNNLNGYYKIPRKDMDGKTKKIEENKMNK